MIYTNKSFEFMGSKLIGQYHNNSYIWKVEECLSIFDNHPNKRYILSLCENVLNELWNVKSSQLDDTKNDLKLRNYCENKSHITPGYSSYIMQLDNDLICKIPRPPIIHNNEIKLLRQINVDSFYRLLPLEFATYDKRFGIILVYPRAEVCKNYQDIIDDEFFLTNIEDGLNGNSSYLQTNYDIIDDLDSPEQFGWWQGHLYILDCGGYM